MSDKTSGRRFKWDLKIEKNGCEGLQNSLFCKNDFEWDRLVHTADIYRQKRRGIVHFNLLMVVFCKISILLYRIFEFCKNFQNTKMNVVNLYFLTCWMVPLDPKNVINVVRRRCFGGPCCRRGGLDLSWSRHAQSLGWGEVLTDINFQIIWEMLIMYMSAYWFRLSVYWPVWAVWKRWGEMRWRSGRASVPWPR